MGGAIGTCGIGGCRHPEINNQGHVSTKEINGLAKRLKSVDSTSRPQLKKDINACLDKVNQDAEGHSPKKKEKLSNLISKLDNVTTQSRSSCTAGIAAGVVIGGISSCVSAGARQVSDILGGIVVEAGNAGDGLATIVGLVAGCVIEAAAAV